MPRSRDELRAAFLRVVGREPTGQEMSALVRQDALPAMRQRAESYVGTPYLWGGTTKQGIDCSAFISNVWGVGRHTTDTLQKVAAPVNREELEPGDALNLPTWKDPRGYGHVRMFDGWADPEKKSMYVYESSSATGGVVRRVIPYDAAYQPMRLKTSDAAEQRADSLAVVTAQAGVTTPSRPPDPAPIVPVERQRFEEANAAPQSGARPAPKPKSPTDDPLMALVLGESETSMPSRPLSIDPSPAQRPPRTEPAERQETPNEKAAREFRQNAGMYEQFNKSIQSNFGEPLPVPSFSPPGVPPLPEFRRPPPLPPPPPPRRYVLGR